jgi:hypothetical protein
VGSPGVSGIVTLSLFNVNDCLSAPVTTPQTHRQRQPQRLARGITPEAHRSKLIR